MTVNTSHINYTFRLIYVLAIFMIIDGHIGSYDYLSLNGLFAYQNYHIALFVFASGYFINLKRTYKEFMIHKFNKLIVPLYLWNIIYGGVVYILNHHLGFNMGGDFNLYNLLYAPLIDGHQYIYNMASWFLVPLFIIQVISFVILKPFYNENKKLPSHIIYSYLVISFLLGCVALSSSSQNFGERNIALLGYRSFYLLPFYVFGIFYHYIFEKHDNLSTPLYLLLIISATIFLRILFPDSNITPSWLNDIHAPSFIIYTISVLALLFWLRIAKIFTPIVKKSKTLNYISLHTFDIMMHHFVAFMIVKALLSPWGNFNDINFKSSIWYYHFPFGETLCSPIYITITLVMALFIGFTSRKICGIVIDRTRDIGSLFKGEK